MIIKTAFKEVSKNIQQSGVTLAHESHELKEVVELNPLAMEKQL